MLRVFASDVVKADRGRDELGRAVVTNGVTAEVEDEEELLFRPDPKLARRLSRIPLVGRPDLTGDLGAGYIPDADDEHPRMRMALGAVRPAPHVCGVAPQGQPGVHAPRVESAVPYKRQGAFR